MLNLLSQDKVWVNLNKQGSFLGGKYGFLNKQRKCQKYQLHLSRKRRHSNTFTTQKMHDEENLLGTQFTDSFRF
jgi:hypothetical protein